MTHFYSFNNKDIDLKDQIIIFSDAETFVSNRWDLGNGMADFCFEVNQKEENMKLLSQM